jgi:putative glutamine amidotransferase
MVQHKKNLGKPIIGITCGELYNKTETWSPVSFGQSRTFVDSVLQAGGLPLLLPLTNDDDLLEQLSSILDGLLLSGGNDLDPKLYGQKPLASTNDYSALRDETETKLLRRTLATNKPILGICRGMQLLNVYFGGDLHQTLGNNTPDSLDHDASTKLKTLVDTTHALRLNPKSQLASILGPQDIGANAHHHQAIDTLGNGVKAVAWASDNVIEGIELSNYTYALGVQPHPESLTKIEPRWEKLFTSFVRAAISHKNELRIETK